MKKFLAFLIIVLLFASIAFLALGNDMFMLLAITKDQNKAAITLTEEVAGYKIWSNYDLKVTDEEKFNNEVITKEIAFKMLVKDSGVEFIAEKETVHKIDQAETTVSTMFYYKEGVLYKDVDSVKSFSVTSYSNALIQVFGATNVNLIFLPSLDAISFFESSETFTTTLTASTSPFYVGQKFVLKHKNNNDTYETAFKFDLFRNYRGLDYKITTATNKYVLNISVLTINKPLKLNFPTSFDAFI